MAGSTKAKRKGNTKSVPLEQMERALYLMECASFMAATYDEHRDVCKYVHSTSRGHEAIQLATAFHLREGDFVYPYYRDESMLLGMGFSPLQLMLQLLGKANDPFSGGRSYYSHPSFRGPGFPVIPHQSSATGMQAIPATGAAQGIAYRESQKLVNIAKQSIALCSLGDGSVTEGEVSEAFQFAALHQLPIVYLVQDNDWGISVSSDEARTMNAYEFAAGFKGLKRLSIDGSDFETAFTEMQKAIDFVRKNRQPILVHATVPLLGHHTSGVRKEWYRSAADLRKHKKDDPLPIMRNHMLQLGKTKAWLSKQRKKAKEEIAEAFNKARKAAEPKKETLTENEFAPSPVTEEKGLRKPKGKNKVVMVDAALFAMKEIMAKHPEALFYGQDVGRRLGGVFREAATLADTYGDERVFNTAIQEAYLVGSTAGMSATGCKPVVEIQFADYIWPSVNQLVTELSKSCYLSRGKFPIQSLIRIPIGAYGGGGPYHSGCIESSILPVKGIKIIYPSNAADMKGLLKGAFYDPNPVICFEHKGLYWSKVPGTKGAMTVEPDEDYIIPLGKGRIDTMADPEKLANGETIGIITYGMGVYWAKKAAETFKGQLEIIDLRSLNPLDEELIFATAKKHNKVIVLTEEPKKNSFAECLAGRISEECFEFLDAPVKVLGSVNVPAIPLNISLEKAMLCGAAGVKKAVEELLNY